MEQRLTVIVTAHARSQVEALGPPAAEALEWLGQVDADEVSWLAEPLPPQHGRDMWLLWADGVRVLFDIEGSDLTVHGLGLRPRSRPRPKPRRRAGERPAAPPAEGSGEGSADFLGDPGP